MTSKPKERIFVSVDIEKTGSMLSKHKVISVGFVIANFEGLLNKIRINMDVIWKTTNEGGDFEPRCWYEFWSKQPDHIIDACKVLALPQDRGWFATAGWIDNLKKMYPSDKYIITFLTDNASFDIASIDNNFEKYVNRLPMRYSTDKEYRSIISADDMFAMLPDNVIAEYTDKINKLVKHDHKPENDAHYIFLQYFYAQLYREGSLDALAKKWNSQSVKTIHWTD